MGMVNRNFHLVKLLCGLIFNPIVPYSVPHLLAYFWHFCTYQRRSYVVAVLSEILRLGGKGSYFVT